MFSCEGHFNVSVKLMRLQGLVRGSCHFYLQMSVLKTFNISVCNQQMLLRCCFAAIRFESERIKFCLQQQSNSSSFRSYYASRVVTKSISIKTFKKIGGVFEQQQLPGTTSTTTNSSSRYNILTTITDFNNQPVNKPVRLGKYELEQGCAEDDQVMQLSICP